jgi:transposase
MNMIASQPQFNHIVAVEVSKHELVIHTLPADRQERIANDKGAVRRLLKREAARNLKHGLGPLLVVCEATGGYERHVLDAAAALQLPLHRAHGSRTRLFARFQGKLAKTDSIDAGLIARYGLITPNLPLYQPPAREQQALRALRKRRDEIVEMLRMELNRAEHATQPRLKASLNHHRKWLEAERQGLEAEIAALIANTPELRHKADLMGSIKGIGPATTAACLAYLPELGQMNKAQAAAITGLAPHANDSGKFNGPRHITGGRSSLRASLYMAALVASRFNPKLRRFAQNLRQRGKPNKLIITAIMRKLIVIINAVIASDKPAFP